MNLRPRSLMIIMAGVWSAACSQEPSAPIAATLEVRLTSPSQNDGAVLFTISGGPIDSVDAMGHAVFTARIEDNKTRIIVAGDLASGAIARIHVGDSRDVTHYSAILHQVAARSYAQRDVASYDLSLAP